MAAGNKKKKKPAANPARGFATTSTQSKSKIGATSTAASETATVETLSTPIGEEDSISQPQPSQSLQDLSPEELEAQLEASELQQFVDSHALKVKKDASRHVSRLRTDKRVLRGQADFLSVKQWLPDELILEILDLVHFSADQEEQSAKKQVPAAGDDVVVKVWNLRLVLVELGIPVIRVTELITYLLHSSLAEDSTSQIWGLSEALDWLALNCTPDELLEYDNQTKRVVRESDEDLDESAFDSNQDNAETFVRNGISTLLQTENASDQSHANYDFDVSDVDSDLEPDELVSLYLRTKETLYGMQDLPTKANDTKTTSNIRTAANTGNIRLKKLQQKLRKIESDMLFDQREADAQWTLKKITLAQNSEQRRKLDLPVSKDTGSHTTSDSDKSRETQSGEVVDDVTNLGKLLLNESEDSDDSRILSSMFDSIPGTHEPGRNEEAQNSSTITVRDFGNITGMTPRRIFEETCRSRDSRCKILYKQISQTTYSCRHSLAIKWTKDQDILESAYMKSVDVKSKPRHCTVTMVRDAAPDISQSESYVATAALFLIFSSSPKEEKSHLRLPPAYRDLWHEFAALKQEYIDAADRETIRGLRKLIENQTQGEDGQDDEVVFSASSRRLNGLTTGTTTPTRPQTPRVGESESPEVLKDMWAKKISMHSYQQMLMSRMNLPMYHFRTTSLETIEKNQVTIIVGDTGSGKSTQIPQFILGHELSHGRKCKIYCTEPRRISAISLAQRVSLELGENRNDLGTSRSLVGYAIRLESQAVSQTKLIYATTGILLRRFENDDCLEGVSHLILDEVHERNIDTDFLLIVLRSLMQKRPDLKIVLMSATIDAQKFSQYLHGAPIITVPGRTFHVKSVFLEDAIEITGHSNDDATAEIEQEDEEVDADRQTRSESSQYLRDYSDRTKTMLATYDEYKIDYVLIVKLLEVVAFQVEYQGFSQAILIFVPGIQEIRQLHDTLLGHSSFSQGWQIYALHSTFSSEDQQAAFDIPREGMRKIVIATNIAETGITIPDITCVIDTGKHREMRFDERRQMSRLNQSFVSKANAKQRRGRAGRVQEGICFHLFTKYRYEELMAEQQTPEMLRLSLQDLVMRVKICKLGNVEDALSQALDPPSSKNVRRAIDALTEVGALTSNEQLTPLGSQLAKLPLDAQLGKLLLYGACFRCLDFALTVAATLSSKTPFLSPMHAKRQAETVRLGFKRGDSDLLTLFNAYEAWRNVCNTRGLSEYQFCNKNFLSPQNLSNIEDLKKQLLISVIDAGFLGPDANLSASSTRTKWGHRHRNFVSVPEEYSVADSHDLIASSVVAWSFYPKILKRDGKGWRSIANNQSLALHPTSVNKTSLPPDVKYLSFYSIMQSSSKFTNAQETTPVSDFALVLLAGDAVFHMYAGVIVIDGNRLRFKVKDWKTMIILKTLRGKLGEALGRKCKYPGRELGHRHRRWMELIEKIFENA